MLKRFTTSLFCLFLIFASIPFIGDTQFLCSSVYADSDLPTGYTPANTDTDLASSFNDYVKSRNANFNGSLPDAANIYILNLMNKGAQNLNTNLDTIKSKIAKKSDTGGRIIWYFDSTVTNFYNSLFDFLLQDLDLSVGDTANEELYNGFVFTDDNNNSCLCTVTTTVYNSYTGYIQKEDIKQVGTPFIYEGSTLFNNSLTEVPFVKGGRTYTFTLFRNSSGVSLVNSLNNYRFIYKNDGTENGFLTIFYAQDDHLLYYGSINTITGQTYNGFHGGRMYSSYIQNGGANQSTVNFVTIDNRTINNNNYEGDTYITNEGDVINNVTPGGQNPGWDVGGGQGSYEDNSGNSYTINFPDFELPDLNIDWSIQGLGNKFPFSIPFDIVSLVTVLNAEPEAPRFQGTVNFGFTTWDYDINLQQFDNVAQVCRIAELLLLVFGLILITRSIIKG